MQRYVTRLVDDLDGSAADGTVSFGIDGDQYLLDLSNANETCLRAAFEPYLAVARVIGPVLRSRPLLRIAVTLE